MTRKARARTRRVPGQMNKVEQAYAAHLDSLIVAGTIVSYRFEAITLKLAPDCRYTPDFFLVMPDGSCDMHEVKGTKVVDGVSVPYIKEDSAIKIRVAGQIFHEFAFRVIWLCKKEGWQYRDFGV